MAFANDMLEVLGRKQGLYWKIGTAEGGTNECVDIIGWKGETQRVLIEVELRRIAPLANVVKVWKQLSQDRPRKRLIMFQVFSAFYPKKGTQRGNAQFVGQEMEEACAVKYISLPMKYRPAKRRADQPVMLGAGRRRYHARNLARRVIARLSKMRFKA